MDASLSELLSKMRNFSSEVSGYIQTHMYANFVRSNRSEAKQHIRSAAFVPLN